MRIVQVSKTDEISNVVKKISTTSWELSRSRKLMTFQQDLHLFETWQRSQLVCDNCCESLRRNAWPSTKTFGWKVNLDVFTVWLPQQWQAWRLITYPEESWRHIWSSRPQVPRGWSGGPGKGTAQDGSPRTNTLIVNDSHFQTEYGSFSYIHYRWLKHVNYYLIELVPEHEKVIYIKAWMPNTSPSTNMNVEPIQVIS